MKEPKRKILSEHVQKFTHPFILKDIREKVKSASTSDLQALVNEQKLNTRKIGRINVYWNDDTGVEKKSRTSDNREVKKLELNLEELQHQLMEARKKIQRLERIDAMDDPWMEVAMNMAHALSEMRQVTIKEVLEHFNAPET